MITQRYSAADIQKMFPDLKQVSEVFEAFERHALQDGMVVCQFRVNGLGFSEQDEKKAKNMFAHEIEHVEILVDTPDNLLHSVIKNWVEDLPRLIGKADEVAEGLRDGGLQSQYTPLVRLIDHCQFLTDSLVSIRGFAKVADTVSTPRWEETEKAMARSVLESLEAFEKKDANWLADVIEYDLAQCLQTWLELLGELDGKLSTT